MEISIYGLKLKIYSEKTDARQTPHLHWKKAIADRGEDLKQEASTYQTNGSLTYVTSV